MSQKKKSGKAASRKRPFDDDGDLSYNDVANLTEASPLIQRTKPKTQHNPKGNGNMKPPANKKNRVPAKIVDLDSPKKVIPRKLSPTKGSPTTSKQKPNLALSSINVGSKVKISKKTDKHRKFRGQIGSVVSISALWTKVKLIDEDGEEVLLSFKKSDILEVESSSQNKDVDSKKRDSSKLKSSQDQNKKKIDFSYASTEEYDDEDDDEDEQSLSYPKMPSSDLSSLAKSKVFRVLNHDNGLLSGKQVAALTKIAIDHEIKFITSKISSKSKDGQAMIQLFGKIAKECSKNIPIAIKEARHRRTKVIFEDREKEMNIKYALLEKEEHKWLKLEEQVDQGHYDTKLVPLNDDDNDFELEEEQEEDGVDYNQALSKTKSNIETLSMVLDEQTTKVRKLEQMHLRAREVQQQLVSKNKVHQFDRYPGTLSTLSKNGKKDIKELIRNFTS